MKQLLLKCKACNKIFPSGIAMGPGASVTIASSVSKCIYCGSIENIPDGTFKATVDGLIGILQESKDPLNEARALLSELKKVKDDTGLSVIKKSTTFTKYKDWLPNNLQNLASYAAIVAAIIGIMMFIKSSRPQNTEVNLNTIVNQEYNQIINIYNKNINNYQK